MGFLAKGMYGDNESERTRFASAAQSTIASGSPLRLQLGFGRHPLPGFLNLDFRYRVLENTVSDEFFASSFIFNWPAGIPVPDDSVDFIFHEDMYEHLDQKEQYYLLAEALRVLVPGRYHRINCPNLEYIMRTRSDFTKGHQGIYDEWAAWHHKNVPTKVSLAEQARIVGYSSSDFNGKNQTLANVKFRERRPGGQFDQIEYNVFADLRK